MKSKFDNILTSSDERVTSGLADIIIRTSGTLALSVSAARQLVAGSTHINELRAVYRDKSGIELNIKKMDGIAELSGKLHNSAVLAMYSENDTFSIDVNRGEVELLRFMIEARMLHCEGERDIDNPAFDPDLYILQKLILMEIISWLSVKTYSWNNPISRTGGDQ